MTIAAYSQINVKCRQISFLWARFASALLLLNQARPVKEGVKFIKIYIWMKNKM